MMDNNKAPESGIDWSKELSYRKNGGSSGSAGAVIDDSTTSDKKTWSSKKIDEDISGLINFEPKPDIEVPTMDEHNALKEEIAKKVSDVTVNGVRIMQDGIANIPTATSGYSSSREYGVVAPYADSFSDYNGMLSIRNPTAANIAGRTSRTAITASMLDDAVKAAMCDGQGTVWTEAEKQAALERLGIHIGMTQADYDSIIDKGNDIYVITENAT